MCTNTSIKVETNLKRLSVHMLVLRVVQIHAGCEDIYNSVELLERYSIHDKPDIRIHDITNVSHTANVLWYKDNSNIIYIIH